MRSRGLSDFWSVCPLKAGEMRLSPSRVSWSKDHLSKWSDCSSPQEVPKEVVVEKVVIKEKEVPITVEKVRECVRGRVRVVQTVMMTQIDPLSTMALSHNNRASESTDPRLSGTPSDSHSLHTGHTASNESHCIRLTDRQQGLSVATPPQWPSHGARASTTGTPLTNSAEPHMAATTPCTNEHAHTRVRPLSSTRVRPPCSSAPTMRPPSHSASESTRPRGCLTALPNCSRLYSALPPQHTTRAF